MNLRLYYPCKPYSVFQAYGQCDPQVCSLYKQMGLKGHNGDDVICPVGTPLRATHDGVVTFAGEDGSNGYLVVLRTDKEYDYKGKPTFFKTLYAHLKKDAIYVKAGQTVGVGDVIALSGNTGLSTGPHLHFGLKPVYQGEQDWQWFNLEQSNGYFGAIDAAPYWTGIFAEDYGPTVTLYQRLLAALQAALQEINKPH